VDPKFASLTERLATLKARDVMTSQPIVLTAETALSDALATLQRHAITGCPVVDDQGRLVGMLSLWDIARTTGKSQPAAEGKVCLRSSPDLLAAKATVIDRMSPNVGTVAETQPLVEVARLMCRETGTACPSSRRIDN
jgi:CBS domain-containing protein